MIVDFMTEDELDDWFFTLPACAQSVITRIEFDEENATDEEYDEFDDAVREVWDSLTYEEKLTTYEEET